MSCLISRFIAINSNLLTYDRKSGVICFYSLEKERQTFKPLLVMNLAHRIVNNKKELS